MLLQPLATLPARRPAATMLAGVRADRTALRFGCVKVERPRAERPAREVLALLAAQREHGVERP